MFFNHIRRNSRRNRKENSLFFGSLVVAIVAFYVLLSLESQDVISFLKTMESDAVSKLLLLIPVVYAVSLFFVFFLVYFANKYQIQRRHHEFGLYQVLGMKRGRIFSMLMGETIWNSIIALLIGIPVAVFLTELISLTTAKLVGLGIIGHQFRISWPGLLGTVVGVFAVQLLAMFILSVDMSRKEPIELLQDENETSQRVASVKQGWTRLFLGIGLLLIAYATGLFFLPTLALPFMLVILITGISGTFLLFRGIATFIGQWVRKRTQRTTGLATFTGRQLQENVLHQSAFLAIGSLLILAAMISLSYGVATALGDGDYADRTVDISLQGEQAEIEQAVNSEELSRYIHAAYPMNLTSFASTYYDENGQVVGEGIDFSWDGLQTAIETMPGLANRDQLVQRFSYDTPFLVSLSSFNNLLESIGRQGISLAPGELAFYSSGQFATYNEEFKTILQTRPKIRLDETAYTLAPELQTLNLVADRFISIMYALIVPDDLYQSLAGDEEPFCWNVVLDPGYIEEQGLMQALLHVNSLFANTGLPYESYLTGIGRQLFYLVAGSYLTLYLGVLFLIIANTILGLKFLMQQRSTKHRYETLLFLGAKEEALCASARTQVRVYFALVIGVAVVSSVFGIGSMINGFMPAKNFGDMSTVILISGIAVIVFLLIELCYIWLIQSASSKEILKLNNPNKG